MVSINGRLSTYTNVRYNPTVWYEKYIHKEIYTYSYRYYMEGHTSATIEKQQNKK